MLLNDQPLWLPQGSVRSILALGIVAAFVLGQVPIEIVTLIVGFYFGDRAGASEA